MQDPSIRRIRKASVLSPTHKRSCLSSSPHAKLPTCWNDLKDCDTASSSGILIFQRVSTIRTKSFATQSRMLMMQAFSTIRKLLRTTNAGLHGAFPTYFPSTAWDGTATRDRTRATETVSRHHLQVATSIPKFSSAGAKRSLGSSTTSTSTSCRRWRASMCFKLFSQLVLFSCQPAY